MPYDVVEDAIVWMRNDPEFYRKEYFPAVASMADKHRAGKKIDGKSCLGELAEKGITGYCQKYNLAKSPDDVFTQQHRDAIIDQLFMDEIEAINKGDYL